MPGPAPKHPSARARRNSPPQLRALPAGGRTGATPPWPLAPDLQTTARLEAARDHVAQLQAQIAEETDKRKRYRLRRELDTREMEVAELAIQVEQADDAQLALWNDLWTMPQAVLWEEAHAHREVAQYVMWKIRAEHGDLDAAKEARQLSDRLGLNPLALLRLRAEVEHTNELEDRGEQRRSKRTTTGMSSGPHSDPRATLRSV